MRPEVAAFLLDLVNRVQISAADPNLLQQAALVSEAKESLAALAQAQPADQDVT